MAFRFKPLPGLTAVTVICLGILISLGTWQYHRLQWKTALLAEVDASVTAPPLTSLRELERLMKSDAPVDFRRLIITAQIDKSASPYFVYKSRQDGIFWRAFLPLTESGISLFAGIEDVRDQDKTSYDMSLLPEGDTVLAGYVRKDHPMGRIESWVKSQASLENNRYFKFNQTGDWGNKDNIKTDIYLDIILGGESLSQLPPKRPEIRNNHFDYMLTWYSFAIILLIIYFLIHSRQGRLSFK